MPAYLLERGSQQNLRLVDQIAGQDHHVKLVEPALGHESQWVAAGCCPPVEVEIGKNKKARLYDMSPAARVRRGRILPSTITLIRSVKEAS